MRKQNFYIIKIYFDKNMVFILILHKVMSPAKILAPIDRAPAGLEPTVLGY